MNLVYEFLTTILLSLLLIALLFKVFTFITTKKLNYKEELKILKKKVKQEKIIKILFIILLIALIVLGIYIVLLIILGITLIFSTFTFIGYENREFFDILTTFAKSYFNIGKNLYPLFFYTVIYTFLIRIILMNYKMLKTINKKIK